jgi:hypothetical protein
MSEEYGLTISELTRRLILYALKSTELTKELEQEKAFLIRRYETQKMFERVKFELYIKDVIKKQRALIIKMLRKGDRWDDIKHVVEMLNQILQMNGVEYRHTKDEYKEYLKEYEEV